MHMQSRLPASRGPMVPSWNQLKVIAHLMERTISQVQHATASSTGFTALRRGRHKMQVWCEHIHPCWHAYERLYLVASMYNEGSIFLRGEGMLCQK